MACVVDAKRNHAINPQIVFSAHVFLPSAPHPFLPLQTPLRAKSNQESDQEFGD